MTGRRELWEVVDGRLVVHLHEGQARAWRSTRRFVWMLAGTQGGKTSMGPVWLCREIQRCGPGDYLAVTSTYPLLRLKMLPEFLRLFEQTLKLGTWHGSDRVFTFHDRRTRIIFGSASNSESLESATALAAWLDEAGQDAFRLESWEAIQRRLALRRGRVLGGTTLYNLGWLKSQIFDAWRSGDTDHDVIQFASTANPAFPQEEFDRAARVLPRWKLNMFYRGEFDRPAGLVYVDYLDLPREQGGHLVTPFDVPPEWPRRVGVDFGPVHTATVWLAEDPQSHVWYAYHETLSTEPTTVAAQVVAARRTAAGVNVRTWHGGSASEDQQRRDWTEAGITVLAPIVHDVEAGIDRVIALFKTFRLYVFSSLSGLRDELGTYSRELNEYGEVTAKIKDQQRWHRNDALRYVCQAIDVFDASMMPKEIRIRDTVGTPEQAAHAYAKERAAMGKVARRRERWAAARAAGELPA